MSVFVKSCRVCHDIFCLLKSLTYRYCAFIVIYQSFNQSSTSVSSWIQIFKNINRKNMLWRRCIHLLFLCRASENRKCIDSNLQPHQELHKNKAFYKWSSALFHAWSTSFYENNLEIIFIQVATKISFQDCWYWMEKKQKWEHFCPSVF
jgi:hypothetical protein